jgi:thioredoxin-dependent peroxiredoxin
MKKFRRSDKKEKGFPIVRNLVEKAYIARQSVIASVVIAASAAILAGAQATYLTTTAEGNKSMSQQIEAAGPAKLNEQAPDFELPSESGKTVHLSDFRGKKAVVVYFYPKDNTPICTAESCAFRDAYEEFKDEGAEVIGISSDSVDSHKGFAEKNKLPFILLSDTGGKVRSQWGVPNTLGMLPGRVSYVIDKKGIIRNIFNSQLDGTKHVTEAKKILSQIKSE